MTTTPTLNKPTPVRNAEWVGHVVPAEHLYKLPFAERAKIIDAHRGRNVNDLNRDDDAFITQGLWRSRARIDGAFAARCEAHDAAPGSPCWGSRLSGVYGLCHARYTVGIAAASRARFPLSLEDDLAERARIARLKNDRTRASLLQVADRETRARRARR